MGTRRETLLGILDTIQGLTQDQVNRLKALIPTEDLREAFLQTTFKTGERIIHGKSGRKGEVIATIFRRSSN